MCRILKARGAAPAARAAAPAVALVMAFAVSCGSDDRPVPDGDHAEVIARLRKVPDRFYDHHGGRDSGDDLDEDDFAELRALGYIK